MASEAEVMTTEEKTTKVEAKTTTTETKENVVSCKRLSNTQMFTQILLMTLQSKADYIDVSGLENIINKSGADPFVIDDDGNSLLHWCAWRKLPNLTKYLIDTYQIKKFQILNNLLQNPMHWSSMSGDIESMKLYIQHSDLSYLSKDMDGYNCLHSAVQLNQSAVLEFFLLKFGNKLDLNQIDNKGRTVFHWAVFKEHIIVIEWLLQNYNNDALQQFIHIQDVYGDTALHIASKRNKLKSIKAIITFMKNDDILYNSINIQNLDKKTCLDIAKESQNKVIYKILNRVKKRKENCIWSILMDIYGNNDFFNDMISTSTMKKIGFVFTIYFFVMQMGGIMFYYFVYLTSNMFIDGIFFFFGFGALLLWLLTHCSDPGTIAKPSYNEIKEMFTHQNTDGKKTNKYTQCLLSGETTKICITCRCVKEFRSKHCAFCNRCVKKFDHHCPWVNNCIGDGNYKLFILFMMIQSISMILFLIFSSIYYVNHAQDISYILITILVTIWVVLAFGTTIFVMMQLGSHIKLITNGYTTNEFINMMRYNYFRDKDGNLRNPFANGCCKNWIIFLFESCNKNLKSDQIMKIEDAPIIAKAMDMESHKQCSKHHHHNNV